MAELAPTARGHAHRVHAARCALGCSVGFARGHHRASDRALRAGAARRETRQDGRLRRLGAPWSASLGNEQRASRGGAGRATGPQWRRGQVDEARSGACPGADARGDSRGHRSAARVLPARQTSPSTSARLVPHDAPAHDDRKAPGARPLQQRLVGAACDGGHRQGGQRSRGTAHRGGARRARLGLPRGWDHLRRARASQTDASRATGVTPAQGAHLRLAAFPLGRHHALARTVTEPAGRAVPGGAPEIEHDGALHATIISRGARGRLHSGDGAGGRAEKSQKAPSLTRIFVKSTSWRSGRSESDFRALGLRNRSPGAARGRDLGDGPPVGRGG